MSTTTDHPNEQPHLVLGDDLSPGADVAWLWVNSQRWPGWTLVDLRAESPPFGAVDVDSDARAVEGPLPRTVHDEPGFADVQFLTAAADPRVALAGWPDAALVVVGGASSGSGPRFIGSTTEWLLHQPTSPVLVARRGRPVRSAIVCADGSEFSMSAARTLAAMPWAGDVSVEVLAIEDGRTDAEGALGTIDGVLDGAVGAIDHAVRRGRSPHREILARAQEADADLVVLGTHGLSTIRRLTLGSTANAVAQLSDSSVLVSAAPG